MRLEDDSLVHAAKEWLKRVGPDFYRAGLQALVPRLRHVVRMGESRNAYRVLVGRPEGKRPLGRPRRRWEDNIKMDLREVGYDGHIPETCVQFTAPLESAPLRHHGTTTRQRADSQSCGRKTDLNFFHVPSRESNLGSFD
ncbi:hypothetical protein ANN_16036 [Periplaneta americana]|uniref:Uncharacterized protein n=1 Tax=Periplaneta americana TaxID=6978 RepID=A0ABQ8SJT5_PERAM|nr:hypothetical protein ANN_16036 [Periplaneta americana]